MASLVSATNGDLNEEEALQRALRESKTLHIAEKQIQSDATIAKLLFTRLNGYNTVNHSIKERNERNTAKKTTTVKTEGKGYLNDKEILEELNFIANNYSDKTTQNKKVRDLTVKKISPHPVAKGGKKHGQSLERAHRFPNEIIRDIVLDKNLPDNIRVLAARLSYDVSNCKPSVNNRKGAKDSLKKYSDTNMENALKKNTANPTQFNNKTDQFDLALDDMMNREYFDENGKSKGKIFKNAKLIETIFKKLSAKSDQYDQYVADQDLRTLPKTKGIKDVVLKARARQEGGKTIYKGSGRPKNTDYKPDGTLRYKQNTKNDEAIARALSSQVNNGAKSPGSAKTVRVKQPTVYSGSGRPKATDYTLSGRLRRAKPAMVQKATVYSGSGRPKATDYTASGNLRRAKPAMVQQQTVYSGRGRPRNSDYMSSGMLMRPSAPQISHQPTIYSGRGRPRNSDYMSSGMLNRGGGGYGGGGGGTVYSGRGRPRNSDYTASGRLRR